MTYELTHHGPRRPSNGGRGILAVLEVLGRTGLQPLGRLHHPGAHHGRRRGLRPHQQVRPLGPPLHLRRGCGADHRPSRCGDLGLGPGVSLGHAGHGVLRRNARLGCAVGVAAAPRPVHRHPVGALHRRARAQPLSGGHLPAAAHGQRGIRRRDLQPTHLHAECRDPHLGRDCCGAVDWPSHLPIQLEPAAGLHCRRRRAVRADDSGRPIPGLPAGDDAGHPRRAAGGLSSCSPTRSSPRCCRCGCCCSHATTSTACSCSWA